MLVVLSQRSIGLLAIQEKRDFENEAHLLYIRNQLLGHVAPNNCIDTIDRHGKFYILHSVSENFFKTKVSRWCNELPNAKTVTTDFFFQRIPVHYNRSQHVRDSDFIIVQCDTDQDLTRIGKDTLCQWAYGEVYSYDVRPMKVKKIIFVSTFDHTDELQEIKKIDLAFDARIRHFKFS